MIKSKDALIRSINVDLSDNSTGDISPRDVRQSLLDVIDSVHNLLNDREINALNLGTPDSTSVRFGEYSLSKYNLADYLTSGNTAIGYASLHNNYQGVRNTAIGGYSLTCNIYGSDNVGVGYNSLAGVTTGYANIGIGAYSLNNNKIGDMNIAIGHGAGYYVDRETNKKLFIASHPVNSQFICDNPDGPGLIPLVYGDLDSANLRFGIATRSLHSYGTLQVSGAISPSRSEAFDIGHPLRKWNNTYSKEIYLSGINFDNSVSFTSSTSGVLINGPLLPSNNESYNLGHQDLYWNKAYINELHANVSITVEENNYLNKNLYLASSGSDPFVGYLPEQDLLNAGLTLRVSGSSDPYILFYSDNDECGDLFRRWKTNVNLEIESGNSLRTRSVISPEYCDGMYLSSGQLSHCTRDDFNNLSTIAGIGNINFVADSGSPITEYSINYISPNSGVDISQRFLSRSSNKQQVANRDIITGFIFKYIDEYGSPISSDSNIDRFCISSYDNSHLPNNNLILMKNNENSGVFGINNFTNADGTLAVPNTIFNIRSVDSAVARITSEAEGDVYTKLQLLTKYNCEYDGFEIKFADSGNITDFNVYEASGLTTYLTFNPSGDNKYVGILTSGQEHEMLTIGCSGHPEAVLSMYNINYDPDYTGGYGKIFVKEYSSEAGINQDVMLSFIDTSGNIYQLSKNPCDWTQDVIYSEQGNTVIGKYAFRNRCGIVNPTNVVIGYNSLPNPSGAGYNVIIGPNNGNGIRNGDYNISIGSNSLANCGPNVSNNILIGNNLGSSLFDSNNLLIGNNTPIISGSLTNKDLTIDATVNINESLNVRDSLYVTNDIYLSGVSQSEYVRFSDNKIELHDNSNIDLPQSSLVFSFTANQSADLLILNNADSGIDKNPSFSSPESDRPYARLNGDLQLLGALRFADGTDIESMSGVTGDIAEVSGVATSNADKLNNIFVEGFASSVIDFAQSYTSPTSGIVVNPSSLDEYTIINRDGNLKILQGDFIIAIKIKGEYRPLWVSNESMNDSCCIK